MQADRASNAPQHICVARLRAHATGVAPPLPETAEPVEGDTQ